jgi:hypothetical protein
MPDRYQIIGSSRRDMSGEQFREHARQALADFGTVQLTGAAWKPGHFSFNTREGQCPPAAGWATSTLTSSPCPASPPQPEAVSMT